MKAYFVSDLHLTSMGDPNAQLFLSFLKEASHDSELTHLFLVGDVFDLWVSSHAYFINRFEPLTQILQKLSQQIEVHYFEGNHDLHLRSFWQEQMGLRVHTDAEDFNLAGLRVRVEHGDLIDLNDRGYRFLRWFLRTPVMSYVASHLPERLVARIGEKASHASRHYTSYAKVLSKEQAINKIRSHCQKLLSAHALDFLISGHLHVRDDHQVRARGQTARSINLGTWLDQPCVFVITSETQKFRELDRA